MLTVSYKYEIFKNYLVINIMVKVTININSFFSIFKFIAKAAT
jgi:hypothetical protein